jgi:hypothetical protein
MALGLSILPRPEGLPQIVQLAQLVICGAGLYGLTILALWRAVGCAEGAEAYLLEQTGLKDRLLRWMRVSQ